MALCRKKFLGAILAATMAFSTITPILAKDINVVYAAESTALNNSKAKVAHLTTSLKTNYLGLKNQGTWQTYISQCRNLINNIPTSEKSQKDALNLEVNRAESLVNALGRINQVEKSIQPKSEGGYGNFLGIKNAETWNTYLNLAKTDCEKVDKSVFNKQYEELIGRMNKTSQVVKGIESKYQTEFNSVLRLYNDALASKDITNAKKALSQAQRLGTCHRSSKLEKDIQTLVYKLNGTNNNTTTPQKPSTTDKTPSTSNTTTTNKTNIESQVASLVNTERSKAGLKPLTLDTPLSKVARAKSQDMADKNYFDHTSPTYGSPFDMMKKFGINFSSAGENIAMGQTSAQAVMTAWMNSPGHRANILSANFGKIGVGYVLKNGTPYWTQEFTN